MVGRFEWLVDWIEGCAYSARNEHPRAIARFQRMLSVNGPSAHVSVRVAISYNSIGKEVVLICLTLENKVLTMNDKLSIHLDSS